MFFFVHSVDFPKSRVFVVRIPDIFLYLLYVRNGSRRLKRTLVNHVNVFRTLAGVIGWARMGSRVGCHGGRAGEVHTRRHGVR